MIKCANHLKAEPTYHESVAAVRACFAVPTAAAKLIGAHETSPVLRGRRQEAAAGHYAVEARGTLKFYRVDRPSEGKWAGCTFVKAQASGNYWPIKSKAERESVLARIARDPIAALRRYGQEIGNCGHCDRVLTDAESRAFGLGPVCRAKLGV